MKLWHIAIVWLIVACIALLAWIGLHGGPHDDQ